MVFTKAKVYLHNRLDLTWTWLDKPWPYMFRRKLQSALSLGKRVRPCSRYNNNWPQYFLAFFPFPYPIFSNLGSEDYDSEVDSDDNEEDADKQVEDEDEDDDDDDKVDERGKSLYSPAQHLSDPIWPILPVVSAIRRFRRRRRRRGRRVGRWFRRRRSRG